MAALGETYTYTYIYIHAYRDYMGFRSTAMGFSP